MMRAEMVEQTKKLDQEIEQLSEKSGARLIEQDTRLATISSEHTIALQNNRIQFKHMKTKISKIEK